MAVIVLTDGATTPITDQSIPLLVEIDTVMLVVPDAVPLYVRARKSTVRLVNPTVEKAGDVMADVGLSIWM